MRFSVRAWMAWIVFFGLLPFSSAEETRLLKPALEAKAEVSKRAVTIGEKFRYSLRVTADKDAEVEFPDLEKALESFSVKDSGAKESLAWGKKKIVRWFLLAAYAAGKTTVPKVSVKYKAKADKEWSVVEVPEQPLEVKSLLEKAGAGATLRDIKGPEGPGAKLHRLLVFFLGAVAIAGVYYFFRTKQKTEEASRLSPRPAHEIAYEELFLLKRKEYVSRGKFKEYYFEISLILRRYLENRFDLHAPEMTTEEFLVHAKTREALSPAHKSLLGEFLADCDFVKFAKYAPSRVEADAVYDAAKNFIDETKAEEKAESPHELS